LLPQNPRQFRRGQAIGDTVKADARRLVAGFAENPQARVAVQT
jgi:hypothetical protein